MLTNVMVMFTKSPQWSPSTVLSDTVTVFPDGMGNVYEMSAPNTSRRGCAFVASESPAGTVMFVWYPHVQAPVRSSALPPAVWYVASLSAPLAVVLGTPWLRYPPVP